MNKRINAERLGLEPAKKELIQDINCPEPLENELVEHAANSLCTHCTDGVKNDETWIALGDVGIVVAAATSTSVADFRVKSIRGST